MTPDGRIGPRDGEAIARQEVDLGFSQAFRDSTALDVIAAILSDPEWGVGMLEDIADQVRGTGRDLSNETGEPTWERH